MESERRWRDRRSERGETLIEVLIAVAIIGMVAVTGAGGLATATRIGGENRVGARSETVLRSAAEQLQNPDLAYIAGAGCPGNDTYELPTLAETEAGYTVTISSVAFWTGASDTPASVVGASFDGSCPDADADDLGLQEIVLEVSRPDGGSESLSVMKRRS